jgi:hypothetical protein
MKESFFFSQIQFQLLCNHLICRIHGFLGCYTVQCGDRIPTFRRTVLRSSSGLKFPENFRSRISSVVSLVNTSLNFSLVITIRLRSCIFNGVLQVVKDNVAGSPLQWWCVSFQSSFRHGYLFRFSLSSVVHYFACSSAPSGSIYWPLLFGLK